MSAGQQTWSSGCLEGATPEEAIQKKVNWYNGLPRPPVSTATRALGACWADWAHLKTNGLDNDVTRGGFCGTEPYAFIGPWIYDSATSANAGPYCDIITTNPNGSVSTKAENVRRAYTCPKGYQPVTQVVDGVNTKVCVVHAEQSCGIGNPCLPVTGTKIHQELDYRSGGSDPLEFRRYYNSGQYYAPGYTDYTKRTGGLTNFWSHSFGMRLYPNPSPNLRAIAVRADGSIWHFDLQGKEVLNILGSGGQTGVSQDFDQSWRMTLASGDTEIYSSAGRLLSIERRSGTKIAVAYLDDKISSVADDFGRTLVFGYDADDRLATVTLPGNVQIVYSYSGGANPKTERLSAVMYPDGTTKGYTYDTHGNLTAIVDEAGQQYATYGYSTDGRNQLIEEQHAGGVEHYTFTYDVKYDSWPAQPKTTVVDPRGASRTYTFSSASDGVYRVLGYTGPPCTTGGCGDASKSKTYDANGNVSSEVDVNGVSINHMYDLSRNLEVLRTEGVGTPAARTVATAWHPTFRSPVQIDLYAGEVATGIPFSTTSYSYDASGRVLSMSISAPAATSSITRTRTYTYNASGQVLTEDGPRTDVSDVTTYAYYSCATGAECGQVQTVTDSLNRVTSYDTYDADGQPTKITDPNGVVTTYSYDLRQRLTATCVGGLLPQCTGGELTSREYWPIGRLKRIINPDGSSMEFEYDAAHRLIQVADNVGNRIAYTLDPTGNVIAENAVDFFGILHASKSRIFNSSNQLYQDIGAPSTGSATTTYGYDANGNLASVSGPLNWSSALFYDGLNRLRQTTDPSGITSYTFDVKDNVSTVTDPLGRVTTYTRNGLGDLVAEINSATGATTNTFDSGGNLKTSTDARGITRVFSYDELERVTKVEYRRAGIIAESELLTYDVGANGIGRMTGASNGDSSITWSYDPQGRVLSRTQTVGGVTKNVAMSYSNGRLASMTLPSGHVVAYAHDSAGQLTALQVDGAPVVSGVTYEPLGPVNGWMWGNGTTQVVSYDQDGRFSGSTFNSGTGISQAVTYDLASRITSLSNTGGDNWTYGYDQMDRITSAQSSSAALAWSYDAIGNRQSQTGSLASGYSSDNVTLVYDVRGRLSSATTQGTTTYLYNAVGERVRKSGSAGDVVFVYDQSGHLIGEYSGTGTLIQETVWFGNIPVATLRPGPGGSIEIFYVHADYLATPRLITRPSDNAVVWKWDSDPFGTTQANENPSGLGAFVYNLRFPGQYHDAETGLNYNYFRDYDPQTGRYVESDPIGLRGGMNTYAYVGSRPTTSVDPRGLVRWSGTATGGTFLAAGGYLFTLTSECIGGIQVTAKVLAVGPGAGLGLDVSATTGAATFEDNRSRPDASVFSGRFLSAGASFSIPPTAQTRLGMRLGGLRDPNPPNGVDASATQIGQARSVDYGRIWGLAVGVGFLVGSSSVLDSKTSSCCAQ